MLLKPKVNVLICNHNYGRYIKDAIDSVINQTYPCSMTIVDDGSTDNSWDMIRFTLSNGTKIDAGEQNGIKFYNINISGKSGPINCLIINLPKPLGPSAARNIGILNTVQNTDYYQILDADDYMYSNKVEELVNKAVTDQRIGVVYADYDILNVETGNLIREYKEPFSLDRLMRECIVHSGSLINKQALISVRDQFGIYDENMRTAEDYDLWIRIAKRWLICHVPKSLTCVRVHKNNSTNSVSKETWNKNWQRIQMKNAR